MGYNCILLAVNGRGITIDRKLLVGIGELEFNQHLEAFRAIHRNEAVIILTEADVDEFELAFSRKRGS